MVRFHGRSSSAAPAVSGTTPSSSSSSSSSSSAYAGSRVNLPDLAALPPKKQWRDPTSADSKSQAEFLRGRGELLHAHLHFKAQLPKVSNSQSRASPMDRLGLRVQRSGRCLSIKEVADEYNERNTPIVQYNIYQDRVRQPLYKIAAGDKISRVNHIEVGRDMMSEMKKAVQDESELQLAVERELQDVLQAAATHPQRCQGDTLLPMLPASPAHTAKYMGSPKEISRRSRLLLGNSSSSSSSFTLLSSPVGHGQRIDLLSSPVRSWKGEEEEEEAEAEGTAQEEDSASPTVPSLPLLPPRLKGQLHPANSSSSCRSALKKPLSSSQASTREPTPDKGVRFNHPMVSEVPLL